MIIDPRQLPQLGAPSKAPGFAATTYGNDSATTRTGGGPGGYNYADALNKIIMGRLAKPKVAAAPPKALPKAGGSGVLRHVEAVDPLAGLKEFAQRQAIMQQMAAAAEESAPVPQRLATGQVGVMPHYVADLQHMTASQREAYQKLNPHGYQAV